MELKIGMLSPPYIDQYWPWIEAEMDKFPGAWAPWWTKEALFELVQRGDIDCWIAGEGTTVYVTVFTRVVKYPADKVLQGVFAFGTELDRYMDEIFATLENYAMITNCDRMEVVGREGWVRKLKKFGFKPVTTILSKTMTQRSVN